MSPTRDSQPAPEATSRPNRVPRTQGSPEAAARATRKGKPTRRSDSTDSDDRPEVLLYTDGACSGNPGPGGWGAILLSAASGKRLEISGADLETTNNRMELTAAIEGLRRLNRRSRVQVVTDSRYLVDGMTAWIHAWPKNDWRTSDKKPVKNRDLWEELITLGRRHTIRYEWIRGHEGHPENERCDQMARDAIETALRLRRGPG